MLVAAIDSTQLPRWGPTRETKQRLGLEVDELRERAARRLGTGRPETTSKAAGLLTNVEFPHS